MSIYHSINCELLISFMFFFLLAVQHERGPRNSTLKKQQISYLSEANARLMLSPSQSNVLNLTIGRTPSPKSPPRMIDNVLHLFPPPSFFYNSPPFSRVSPTFFYEEILPIFNCCPQFSSSHPPYPPSPPIFNQFQLAPTTEDTTLPVICESAARLLFMNVQWAVTVPEYMALPVEDQVNLMELAWRDLFVVSIAQLLPLLDLTGPYFSRRITTPTIQRGAEEFKEIVEKIKSMMLDTNEYQTLRHVLLFRASTNLYDKSNIFDLKNLIQKNRVLQLQDEYLTNLNNYIASVHMDQPLRFTKLMLILPHLKTVTNYIIEELFFRKTIGSISLNKIMCDMYRNHLEKIRPI